MPQEKLNATELFFQFLVYVWKGWFSIMVAQLFIFFVRGKTLALKWIAACSPAGVPETNHLGKKEAADIKTGSQEQP
jgi:hypothetical protein